MEVSAATHEDTSSILDTSRRHFLKIILLLIIAGSVIRPFILFILNLADPEFLFNAIVFVLFSFMYFLLEFKKQLRFSSWIMIIISLIATLYLVHDTLQETTNAINTFVIIFPLAAIFLLGKKIGIIFSCLEIISLILLLFFEMLSPSIIFQTMFNIAVAIFILYFYQDTEEKSQQLLTDRGKKLEHAIAQLEDEIKKREEIQVELKQSLEEIHAEKKELERLNAVMVGRELVMADMKQKMKAMEEQLHSTKI